MLATCTYAILQRCMHARKHNVVVNVSVQERAPSVVVVHTVRWVPEENNLELPFLKLLEMCGFFELINSLHGDRTCFRGLSVLSCEHADGVTMPHPWGSKFE